MEQPLEVPHSTRSGYQSIEEFGVNRISWDTPLVLNSPWSAVAPFVPAGLRWRVGRKSGPPLARHGFQKVGVTFGDVPLPPLVDGRQPHPAGDPPWVKEQYLDRRGVDVAILTGSHLSLGVQPSLDLASALARGINDWTLETWFDRSIASRARS